MLSKCIRICKVRAKENVKGERREKCFVMEGKEIRKIATYE